MEGFLRQLVFFLLVWFQSASGTRANSTANMGTFWHLTDVHLDFLYRQSASDPMQVCPSSTGLKPLRPGKWGDYRLVITAGNHKYFPNKMIYRKIKQKQSSIFPPERCIYQN